MTENEALKILDIEKQCLDKSTKGICKINCGDCKKNIPIAYQEKAYEVAISALKEIRQYREIGIVEECREAVEKQNPKEPKEILRHRGGFETRHCTNCNTDYQVDNRYTITDTYCHTCGKLLDSAFRNYCGNCGQAIQWNDDLEGMEDE